MVVNKEIADFEEKLEPIFPNVQQVKIKDNILGKNIVIKDYKELEGDNGTFYVILADVEGKEVSFSCGSKSVNKQVAKLKKDNALPVRACFVKVKAKESGMSYYKLTKPSED